uniref:LBH domain-containing protein n=1 Tax=Sinocyclocheilus grahami TaxID=75366 RepID=A0A672SUP2_SINGR
MVLSFFSYVADLKQPQTGTTVVQTPFNTEDLYYLLSFSFILQIFPDPVEVVLSTEGCLSCAPEEKERLPSIVVEPTDISEVESGELRWPPEDMDFDEDEDFSVMAYKNMPFLQNSIGR